MREESKRMKVYKCKEVTNLLHNIQGWYGNYLLPVVLRIILQSTVFKLVSNV